MEAESRPVKVWDGWVRLFHWGIAGLVFAQWATAKAGLMDWHIRLGLCALALVLFRLAWGLVGSQTARFAAFLKSPAAALRHLGEMLHRGPDREVGHNAAGGWMVLAMLGLLLVQAGTGLFSNEEPGEDYGAHGPLALRVSDSLSGLLTGVHETMFNLLIALVALHVGAVLAYRLLKGHDLVRPMLTGFKRLPASVPAPRLGSAWLAAALLAAAFAVVGWLGRMG